MNVMTWPALSCLALLCCYSMCSASRIQSEVLELNEKFVEAKEQGNWLVEFYAPWCGHCKRLHPIWEQVGHALADREDLHVAKLDCTRYTSAAHELDIHGFPTIRFYKSGTSEPVEFHGDRTKEAIIDFADKLYGPPVRLFNGGEKRFMRDVYNKHAHVGFFLLLTKNDNESSKLRDEYEEVAKSLQPKAYFFVSQPAELPANITIPEQLPAVLSFHDNRFRVYKSQVQDLRSFVERHRWSRYGQISYGNLHDIGAGGARLLVLALVDIVERPKEGSEINRFDKEVQQLAMGLPEDLETTFQLGWADSSELFSSILLTRTAPPSLLVFNTSSQQYYVPADTPQHITAAALEQFLRDVRDGRVDVQGGTGFGRRLYRTGFDIATTLLDMFHSQPLLTLCLFGLPLGLLSIICYTLCSADIAEDREDYFDEDEGDDSLDEHEKLE